MRVHKLMALRYMVDGSKIAEKDKLEAQKFSETQAQLKAKGVDKMKVKIIFLYRIKTELREAVIRIGISLISLV